MGSQMLQVPKCHARLLEPVQTSGIFTLAAGSESAGVWVLQKLMFSAMMFGAETPRIDLSRRGIGSF